MNANFGSGSTLVTSNDVPTGEWLLKIDNEVKAKYNLSYSLPSDASNNLKLPIPSVKLKVAADSQVEGVLLKWYIKRLH